MVEHPYKIVDNVQSAYTPTLFSDACYCEVRIMEKTDRVKYCHPEYSDGEIDGLMKYFRFETYLECLDFLKKCYKKD